MDMKLKTWKFRTLVLRCLFYILVDIILRSRSEHVGMYPAIIKDIERLKDEVSIAIADA
jgi:hypothetical protein